MGENLMERLARVLKSDLSNFLDIEAEDISRAPQKLSELLSQLKSELGEKLAIAHLKSRTLSELSAEHSVIAEKAEFAIAQGRDDLARAALARKFDLSKEIGELSKSLGDIDGETKRLEAAIDSIVSHLNEAERGAASSSTSTEILKELDDLFTGEQTGSKKT